MGYFTEETLQKFNTMCADGVDFGEGPVYDFAKCITSKGEIYGISDDEQCKVGRKIPDDAKISKKKEKAARMARLKAAFIKKTGREMSPEELKKAAILIERTPDPKKKK